MTVLSRLTLGAALAVVAACTPTVTITDSVDFTWDFGLTLDRFEDNLHDPYVRGAQMQIYATSDDDDETYRGWSFESSNPAVLTIEGTGADGYSAVGRAQAVGEGDALITVYDSKREPLGVAEVHVRVPDRVQLEAHGYLILGRDDDADVTDVRMVEGGTATYLVHYSRDGVRLNGNGVLAGQGVTATGAPLGVTPLTSHVFEDREWLQLTSTTAGTQELALFADGAAVASLPVTVVPETAIADVVILAQDEDDSANGDWLVLLAQAFDGEGRRIFGIDYTWNVAGLPAAGVGDLYRYEYDGAVDTMVIAERAGHADSIMIHSGEGFVSSSNTVGCATTHPAGLLAPLGAAAGLLLCASRRRRRARGAASAA